MDAKHGLIIGAPLRIFMKFLRSYALGCSLLYMCCLSYDCRVTKVVLNMVNVIVLNVDDRPLLQ